MDAAPQGTTRPIHFVVLDRDEVDDMIVEEVYDAECGRTAWRFVWRHDQRAN